MLFTCFASTSKYSYFELYCTNWRNTSQKFSRSSFQIIPPLGVIMKSLNVLSKKTIIAALVAVSAGIPMLANAESQFQQGAGALTATARLDFQITIPRVLFLQVGTGTALGTNPAIDLVTFTPTAAQVAAGTANIAAATNGTVAARLLGNGGAISLTATTAGALTTGVAGETISWSQIAATSSLAGFPHPSLVDGPAAGAASTYGSATAKVTNLSANWTFAFNAPAVAPAAGVYGGAGAASPGAGVRNGRVVYTATMP
jgi:hypothetical protein